VRAPAAALLLAALAAAPEAGAQNAAAAKAAYAQFKTAYAAAETTDALRIALGHALEAEQAEPGLFKVAHGIGSVHLRLAAFAECVEWFAKAEDRASAQEDRTEARQLGEYCQNEINKVTVNRRVSSIRISFATKLSFVRQELDPAKLPAALDWPAGDAGTDVTPMLRARLQGHSVLRESHAGTQRYFAGRKSERALGEDAKRLGEYETQIRRRFFPDLPAKPLVYLLGDDPFELRGVTAKLYPSAQIPGAPFFGFYNPRDRLIVATALGGYGTVLHELMHALVRDDFPEVPAWLEEGMATLYERSGWSPEKLLPAPNWRMDLIRPEDALAPGRFDGIGPSPDVEPKRLSLIRLLFVHLDAGDRLRPLYDHVKRTGPATTLADALGAVGFDEAAWKPYVARTFEEYALEASRSNGAGLTNPGEIKFVQQALNRVMGTALKVDGFWGPSSEKALIEFQKKFGLSPDGMAGRNTMVALRREYTTRGLR
jgi:hypothetical protein